MPKVKIDILNMKKEFEWFLEEEVHSVLNETHSILIDCAHKFPVELYGNQRFSKQTKYILSSPYENIKCWAVINGDSITSAELSFKPLKHVHGTPHNTMTKTTIPPDSVWKLQQIQDAANYLQDALKFLDDVDRNFKFNSANQVLKTIEGVIKSLESSANCLIVPKKKPIEQLLKSANMKCFKPNLPDDVAVSFFMQGSKLICAIYQIKNGHNGLIFDLLYAECLVPWVNEILAFMTVALQICQELKDKISVFTEHNDLRLSVDD